MTPMIDKHLNADNALAFLKKIYLSKTDRGRRRLERAGERGRRSAPGPASGRRAGIDAVPVCSWRTNRIIPEQVSALPYLLVAAAVVVAFALLAGLAMK
jgi:hypothetical protein